MAERSYTDEQKQMISVLTQALPILRKELGVSQTVLAQKVGVSRQTISLIERQLYPMTWTLFLAIVFFLNPTMTSTRERKNCEEISQSCGTDLAPGI